jgi:hypothetical protein
MIRIVKRCLQRYVTAVRDTVVTKINTYMLNRHNDYQIFDYHFSLAASQVVQSGIKLQLRLNWLSEITVLLSSTHLVAHRLRALCSKIATYTYSKAL